MSEFLVYPTVVNSKSARILTSSESLALLEAKKQQKEEDEKEKGKKEEQAKKKDQQKKGADKVGKYSGQKRRTPYNPAKTYPIRKRAKNDDTSSSTQVCHDICSVCSECYKDEIEEETGDILPGRDWIQCGEINCGVWSHISCLEECCGGYTL